MQAEVRFICEHINWISVQKAWACPLGGLRGLGGGQNSTFLEYNHVAYKIKADDACSNMVAKILPLDTTLTPE